MMARVHTTLNHTPNHGYYYSIKSFRCIHEAESPTVKFSHVFNTLTNIIYIIYSLYKCLFWIVSNVYCTGVYFYDVKLMTSGLSVSCLPCMDI